MLEEWSVFVKLNRISDIMLEIIIGCDGSLMMFALWSLRGPHR